MCVSLEGGAQDQRGAEAEMLEASLRVAAAAKQEAEARASVENRRSRTN